MKLNNTIKLFLVISMLISASPCSAADVKQTEISHLMQYVENENCRHERNGTEYSGKEAAVHIQKKYVHFRDKIYTTEEFIAYCATKSEISGKPVISSRDWLLCELRRFRQKK